jgi:hypothetical protein
LNKIGEQRFRELLLSKDCLNHLMDIVIGKTNSELHKWWMEQSFVAEEGGNGDFYKPKSGPILDFDHDA